MHRFRQHLPPPQTRQRIGLFGGSFDPVHSGHLHVAETALKRLQLDQVWWFPTPGNPLKAAPGAYAKRLKALQTQLDRTPRMRISQIENLAKIRYTTDLVKLLKTRCRSAKFVWIMGGDSAVGFHRWKAWQALAQTVPIAVIARPGGTLSARTSRFSGRFSRSHLPQSQAARLAGRSAPAWTYLSAPMNPASSTAIRQRGSA